MYKRQFQNDVVEKCIEDAVGHFRNFLNNPFYSAALKVGWPGKVALLALEFPRKRIYTLFQKCHYLIIKELQYSKSSFSVSI